MKNIESIATNFVARLSPWAAPLPTAYLVYCKTVEYLAWPVWVGIVAAVIIECLGLATTATALELREYNKAKRKSDPRAPFGLAAVLVGVYLVVAVGLTVVLDIVPALALYSPAIFPLLSLTGVMVLALRGDHVRRVEGVVIAKAAYNAKQAETRARNKRKAKEAEVALALSADEHDGNGHNRALPFSDNSGRSFTEFERAVTDNELNMDMMTGHEVGAWAGKSAATGRRWKRLAANGNGVEVIAPTPILTTDIIEG